MITTGKAAAQGRAHARILRKADAAPGSPAWLDQPIAAAVAVSVATVERGRQRFVEQGRDAALNRKQRGRPAREPKRDGRAEARLIAVACAAGPQGRSAWTLRLLADQLVELAVVDPIADETVRRALKKTNSSRG